MKLKRLPFIPNCQLEASQSFDQLIIAHSQELSISDQDLILVIDDHFGAISCALSSQHPNNDIVCINDSKSSQSAIKKNMHLNELNLPRFFHSWVKMNESIQLKNYQAVYVFIPWAKSVHHWKTQLEHITTLAQLGSKSHSNFKLSFISGGMLKYYTHQYRDTLNEFFGNSDLSRITKKARLLISNWNAESVALSIDTYKSFTDIESKAQFNEGKVDLASQMLIKSLAQPEVATVISSLKETDKVLDLGAGSGALVKPFLEDSKAEFHLVDESFASIRSLYSQFRSNKKVHIYHSDTFHTDSLTEKKFQFIVSNPPYHQYFSLVPELLYLFIHEAIEHLAANGTFIWVTSTQFNPPRKFVGKYLTKLDSNGAHTVWMYKKTLWG